ncbi:hypothetical protein GPECTOR_11g261 [Gonium pectorale]|uniref:Ankyrin repeat domain-containing protein n=1 Tax=Gonium pectorale TaxID=33097 RepID=A0A150GPT6_GONPE|nr:hypothetical protein GPECTOR_11g261 [Gonium pectorale]|eukprot:KXZ51821.1 hypothetical protein GPECTOR_11g261 [Gonium pectorale]
MERFRWLREREYPREPLEEDMGGDDPYATEAAAASGVEDAILFLAPDKAEQDSDFSLDAEAAAWRGHLHVLKALHSSGHEFEVRIPIHAAARSGHLHVVAWLVEELGAPLDEELFAAAAESGSVELLIWLRERGCPWGESVFTAAAKSGCIAAAEWLAERGCPMEATGTHFLRAAEASDFAMLECLRRLGCPWGPPGKLFADCLSGYTYRIPVLAWLVEAGCPVDWAAALELADARAADRGIFGDRGWRNPQQQRSDEALAAWVRGQADKRRQ